MDRSVVWDLADKCGGVFKFTVLLQKRVNELVRGAPKLVENSSTDPVEIALMEIQSGVIELENLSASEIDELKKSMEEQTAAQSLLSKDQRGEPGEPSTKAITDFLKS